MLNKFRHFAFGKVVMIMFALFSVALVAESCGQKHACGSKSQKRKRNKRIKKSTNFMTY